MKFSRIMPVLLALVPISQACQSPDESEFIESLDLDDGEELVRRQNPNTGIPIGKDDRFQHVQHGAIAPRGLGTQPAGTDLGPLLSVMEIKSAFRGLETAYAMETFETPYETYDERPIFVGKIGGTRGDDSSIHAFFTAAIHGNERGSSDSLLYFLGDLLYAYQHNIGLVYGGRTFTAEDVRKAYSVGIVFIPLSNPDGVLWDLETHTCWSKNRNQRSYYQDNSKLVGVDLSRNFNFLWHFPSLFEGTVAAQTASSSPGSRRYHGPSPESEPETKSIVWVMNKFPSLRWYLDIHSDLGVGAVLYNWGSSDSQSSMPEMNFQNVAYNADRGLMPHQPANGSNYAEYIPSDDWRDKVYAAMRMGNAMQAVTGRHYEVKQKAYLGPVSGSSDDYAYSRHFVDPSKGKIHGFTMQFGFKNREASCPSYPTPEQYHQNILETGAGFMEFLLSADIIGHGEKPRESRPGLLGSLKSKMKGPRPH